MGGVEMGRGLAKSSFILAAATIYIPGSPTGSMARALVGKL